MYNIALLVVVAGGIAWLAAHQNRSSWVWVPLLIVFWFAGQAGAHLVASDLFGSDSFLFVVRFWWGGLVGAMIPFAALLILPPKPSLEEKLAEDLLQMKRLPRWPSK